MILCVQLSDPVLGGKKTREREAKWLKMLTNWDHWMEKYESKVCTCMNDIVIISLSEMSCVLPSNPATSILL